MKVLLKAAAVNALIGLIALIVWMAIIALCATVQWVVLEWMEGNDPNGRRPEASNADTITEENLDDSSSPTE